MNKTLAFNAPKILQPNMTVPAMLGIPESSMSRLFDIFERSQQIDSMPESLAFISRHVDTPQELIFLTHVTIKEMEKLHGYATR